MKGSHRTLTLEYPFWPWNCISSQSTVALTGTNTIRKRHNCICEGPLTETHNSVSCPKKRKYTEHLPLACKTASLQEGALVSFSYPCINSQMKKHLQRNIYTYSQKISLEISEAYKLNHLAASKSTTLISLNSPLLNAKMCVDTGIPSCASEIFVFSVWYVLPCPVVPVLFGQTKVNKE